MAKFKNITGQKFGRLIALFYELKNGLRYWHCKCDCGNFKKILASNLISGKSQSCGCLCKERIAAAHITHGMAKTRTHRCWNQMRQRCTNEKLRVFKHYGGRGIAVCERWDSFENFLGDLGKCPSSQHSIERRNNDLGYFPANCYWATRKEQANNRRSSRYLTFQGDTLTMQQWVEKLGINQGTLSTRLNRHHWSVEKALSTPVRKKSLAST